MKEPLNGIVCGSDDEAMMRRCWCAVARTSRFRFPHWENGVRNDSAGSKSTVLSEVVMALVVAC